METIPVRHIKDSFFEDRFSIRAIEPLAADGDLIHELHRHDFYYILFIKNGNGEHEIDFVKYAVKDFSVFFIRPGQVHRLKLHKGTSGFMIQFTSDFYAPKELPALQVFNLKLLWTLHLFSTRKFMPCRLTNHSFLNGCPRLQENSTRFQNQ